MIKILLLIVFIEALTEILVTSSIFEKLRTSIARSSGFLGELVNCGYCTSVWVSLSVMWVAPFAITSHFWLNYLITALIAHRLSNLLHELNNKWLGRRPLVFAIHKTESVILQDMGEQHGPE